jgi:hypothetical protein
MLMLVLCAAAYKGFYDKWSLRDGNPSLSAPAMLEGTARRPFVYRRLLPETANLAERALPPHVAGRLTAWFRVGLGNYGLEHSAEAADPKYTFRYVALYLLGFVSLVGATGVLTAVLATRYSPAASVGAVGALVLMLPVLQSQGGYVYDFSELLFLGLALLLAPTRLAPLIVPLAAVATYNKESFFFFLPTLLPFLLGRYRLRGAVVLLGAAAAVSLATYAHVRGLYPHNTGGTVFVGVFKNLGWYSNPLNLFRREATYGIPLFAGYSLVTAGLIGVVLAHGWSGLATPDRRHLAVAAAVNLPLFLLFTWPGETRNLSLLFPALLLLTGAALERVVATGQAAQAVAPMDRVEAARAQRA